MTTLQFIEQTQAIHNCDYPTACRMSREFLIQTPAITEGIDVGIGIGNLKIVRRKVYDYSTGSLATVV